MYSPNLFTMGRMWHKVNFQAGLNSKFSFSKIVYPTKTRELILVYYVPIVVGKKRRIHVFLDSISTKWNRKSFTQDMN